MTTCEIGRPAFAETYAVAGRFICVETEDRESALLFRRYFGGWHVSTSESAGRAKADATIAVMSGRVPDSPKSFEAFETAAGGICRTDGRTYFLESDGSVVRVRAESPGRVEVWVGSHPASRERAALARLIFDASMTALRRCGLFELHGAGLIEPLTGTGLLIIGPSGSGKSTLTTQLARAGWNYLSDDSLLLRDGGAHVLAHALRRVFAVTEPTVAAGLLDGFEELLTEPAPFDPLKRRFEPQEVFPQRFAESCVPRAIFFPVITQKTSSHARSLSQAETMRRLLRMCPWACYDRHAAKAHLGMLARLARQAEGFELLSGSDLIGDGAHVSSFMRECIEKRVS
jgi:hypothetical protein